jgi:hypothetical protein
MTLFDIKLGGCACRRLRSIRIPDDFFGHYLVFVKPRCYPLNLGRSRNTNRFYWRIRRVGYRMIGPDLRCLRPLSCRSNGQASSPVAGPRGTNRRPRRRVVRRGSAPPVPSFFEQNGIARVQGPPPAIPRHLGRPIRTAGIHPVRKEVETRSISHREGSRTMNPRLAPSPSASTVHHGRPRSVSHVGYCPGIPSQSNDASQANDGL